MVVGVLTRRGSGGSGCSEEGERDGGCGGDTGSLEEVSLERYRCDSVCPRRASGESSRDATAALRERALVALACSEMVERRAEDADEEDEEAEAASSRAAGAESASSANSG